MIRYVGKRLVTMIPILLGVIFIIFTIMEMTPGDPAVCILGNDAGPEALEAMREELGLNKPYIVRFADYIIKIVTKLDFDTSWRTNNPVFQDMATRIPVSFKLALQGILFATVVGIPLGVLSVVKQYSLSDNILRVTATVMVAMPTFWLAMLLIAFFFAIIMLLVDLAYALIDPRIRAKYAKSN